MQICSFLPSATEIVYALGRGDCLAGVTFECDYPPEASQKAVVVNTLVQSGLSPQEIDRAVRTQMADGGSLYFVDLPKLKAIQPDIVITQDLCRVCAISTPDLSNAISGLNSHPQIISLEPHTIEQIFENISTVGEAIDRVAEARALVNDLRSRVERIRSAVDSRLRPRVLCLEWLSPLFQAGHWIPEMVAIAGGDAILATPGMKSICTSWEQIIEADPEIIIVMPCGFHLVETIAQYEGVEFPKDWKTVSAVSNGRVYAVDGTAYFSRPGPRIVTGIEILQAIFNESSGNQHSLETLPAGSVHNLSS